MDNALKMYHDIPADKSEKKNLEPNKRHSNEKKSHSEQKSFYLVTTQSNSDSALNLKNDIPISKNWKVAEKAGTRCFSLKQLWAPHKLKDKNWFSFLDYQEVGASRSGNLTPSWPAGLDCSQTCSILKRIVWDGREGGGEEKFFGIFCAHWYLSIFSFTLLYGLNNSISNILRCLFERHERHESPNLIKTAKTADFWIKGV